MHRWYFQRQEPRASRESILINSVKLTEFGGAAFSPYIGREDERVAALARRAQQGDYDEGMYMLAHIFYLR